MKSRWIGLVFVVIFSVLFAIRQYQPGTWLMGWDSLHPEFNYGLAFERVISGVWRESQGVGAVAVHSHMSELPRIATLWVIDLFVPTSAVRWIYILLMLVLGVVGSYVLLVHILSRIRGKLGMGWVTMVAIVGSLAYLFNLSTLHHFLVPFEMFIVLFGLLPWSLWSVSRYLRSPSRQRLVFFLLIQFLISSSAFAATLWVVYFGVLALTTWFLTKNKRRWIVEIGSTLMVNSYWLLPTMYGLLTTGGVVASSKINQSFSPEAWLNNVAYGTVQQVARLESFILQWMSFDRVSYKFDLVVSQWVNVANRSYIWLALNIVIGMVGVGLLRWFYLIKSKNDKEGLRWSGLIIVGFLLFLILLSQVWPMSLAIVWARENLSLVGEILRTPFTKVSIFLQLIYSVLIGVGLLWMVEKVRFWFVRIVFILMAVTAIVFPFTQWIINGNLIGDVVVTKMPVEYEKLFELSKKMEDERMVAMPMSNMWGWEYRDWGNREGYEGANFTQFGIAQALLIRDFDRWSSYNEGFYNELSTALYGEKIDDVAKVLKKYDVRYVLLDESVIAPGQGKEILRIEETKKIAKELGWQQKFQEGFLSVWDTRIKAGQQFVSAPSSYTLVEADTSKVRLDVVFDQVGTYVSNSKEAFVTYPFANLLREEVKNIEYADKGIMLVADTVGGELVVPGWKVGDIVRIQYKDGVPVPAYFVNAQPGPTFLGKEKPQDGKDIIYAKVSDGKEWSEYLSERRYVIQGKDLKVEVLSMPQVYDFGTMGQVKIVNCDVLKRGVAEKIGTSYIADGRGAACDYIEMKEIDPRMSYLMRFQGNNLEGRSLKYFLYNTGSKRNDIEYLLGKNKYDQTFSLLSWAWDGYYTLNIETRSFGQRAENLVQPIEVRWFPLEQIAGARIIPSGSDLVGIENRIETMRPDLRVTEVTKTGTWLYRVKVEGNGLLKLSQGYDEGWVSPGLKHVKVDGWANGWMIPQSGEATIFYWPQLLEYLGFLILATTFVLVVFRKK